MAASEKMTKKRKKKGENCTKKGVRGLKITSIWVINSRNLPPPAGKINKFQRWGKGDK